MQVLVVVHRWRDSEMKSSKGLNSYLAPKAPPPSQVSALPRFGAPTEPARREDVEGGPAQEGLATLLVFIV